MIGGAYKISTLTSRVTSGAHVEYHSRILSSIPGSIRFLLKPLKMLMKKQLMLLSFWIKQKQFNGQISDKTLRAISRNRILVI